MSHLPSSPHSLQSPPWELPPLPSGIFIKISKGQENSGPFDQELRYSKIVLPL